MYYLQQYPDAYLHVPHKLWQVEMPLLCEIWELKNEANSVIGLFQTGQALYCPYCIQALERREK